MILSIDLFVIIGRSQMLKRPKFAEAGMVIAAWGVPLAPAITFLVLDMFSGRELWYAQNQHEQTELNIFFPQ